MKKLNYSLTALALVVLAACNKAEMPAFLSDPDAVRIEAAVGALTKSNPLGTQDEQKTFNEGDQIAVTNAGKTVVYKLQNGTWAPENSGEYLKWDKNDLVFTAKYPADYTTLPTDQSTKENLAKADHMDGNYSNGSIPSDHILSMVLERKNALVKIKIAGYLDQYKEGETYIKNLRFNNVQFPLIQDKEGNYVEGSYTMGTVGCTYIAILEPHKDAADEYFVEMILHKANQEEGPLKVKGVPELEAGYAYTFKLYIGKETVKVGSVTVEDWTTGGALSDGETEPVDSWDGQTTEPFATQDAEGSTLGSGANPILINNCAEFAYLAEQVKAGVPYSGQCFRLTDDLNLAGHLWSPIGYKSASGTSDRPFSGTFDGAGHEIMGLKVDANQDCLGLFGYIKSAVVQNLKISSADISSKAGDYGAILCAIAEESEISDCFVSGKVRIEDMSAGGLVAELKNSIMEKCIAEVEVTSQQNAGGLCGTLKFGHISECTVSPGSTMAVIPKDNVIPRVGGLVGYISNEGNDNSLIAYCSSYAKVSGFGNVGGAFGYVDADGSHQIGECTVYGDVSVSLPSGKQNYGIGGFIGTINYTGGTPSFSKCGFNGTVTNADGASFPTGSIYGAFVGQDASKATFSDCWYNADKAGELDAIGENKTKEGITAKNLGK